MKRKVRFVLALMAVSTLAVVLTAGCVATSRRGVIYVRAAPPAAVVEVQGIAPGPEFIWISGYHRWDGTQHAWVAGRWEKRPHAKAVWESGAWRHHRNGWYWTDGRWR
jgi:hypothetical protein